MKKAKVLCLAVGVVLIGCGGDDSGTTAGSAGPTLIGSSSVPADATCPNGGTKISVGVDKNGNGTLDADEVTGSQEICNSSSPSSSAPTLTTVTASAPDATCKNGGVIVKSGADKNGNGTLDDSEVTSTKEICDGGTSTVLATTTSVASGDPNCPVGGTQTQSGADNGNGGGVAGDGILQAGEITSTTYACSSLPGFFPGSFTPPAALSPQPAYTFDTHGGNASAASGATGGSILIGMGGTLGGHIKIFKTGKADASFTAPTHTPDYGAVKLDVTIDTALQLRTDGTTAADGEFYFTSGGLFLRQDSTHNAVQVTGLHVAAGKKFTVPAGAFEITTSHDVLIEGTVTSTIDANGNAGGIEFDCSGSFVAAAGANIIAAGQPTTGAGGNGGPIIVDAASIFNQASLDASGADGNATGSNNGGKGGAVVFEAAFSGAPGGVYNSGAIKANGGNGQGGGNGGNAGAPVLFAGGFRPVSSQAPIMANGGAGSGTTGSGGNGSSLTMTGVGIYSAGAIHIQGGDASATCTGACTGGSVPLAQITANGGPLAISGDIIAHGGKGVGAGGGGGASLNITNNGASAGPVFVPAAGIRMSGNIDLSGGDGASGGLGNGASIQMNPNQVLTGQEIVLLGYSLLKTGSGNGTTGSSSAGAVTLQNNSSSSPSSTATGGVINYADIQAVGGNASASGFGGFSNGVQMTAGSISGPPDLAQVVINAGAINTSGGNGVSTPGSAGPIGIVGRDGVVNTGTITSTSGSSSGASATAVPSLNLFWQSGGIFSNSGTITANGGNASGANGAGSPGAHITIFGTNLTNTKAITVLGGNSNGVAGGTGGAVQLYSFSTTTTNSGALTVTGGTGTPNGTLGSVLLDGVVQ